MAGCQIIIPLWLPNIIRNIIHPSTLLVFSRSRGTPKTPGLVLSRSRGTPKTPGKYFGLVDKYGRSALGIFTRDVEPGKGRHFMKHRCHVKSPE